MSSCRSCGHQLGVGRFCTNCGAPVDSSTPDVAPPPSGDDWRTDTAERTLSAAAADPRTPPAAVAPPPPPRYPLFADEVEGYTPYGPLTTTTSEQAAESAAEPEVAAAEGPIEPEPEAYDYDYVYDEERRSPVLWVLAAALVLVLITAGWWFLVRDDGSDSATDDGGTGQSAQESETGSTDGVDVAGRASVKAPRTAPPNEDVNGDQVSYDASNMLDGVPDTAWRAGGDGAGLKLTFTLREPTALNQVGLVNGYAKTSTDSKGRTFDWYLGNRRIESVIWVFDDGSKVRQEFTETRELQLVDVPDVVTGRVVLKIVKVSPPGEGKAARDFTAISEVSMIGDPTG